MALESVGGALLSASLSFLFERIGSPQVLSYLQGKSKSCDFAELLGKLKLSLISVTALLDDAEHKLTRSTRGVEAWLDELQDAFYDADDAMDEIETDALRLKAEANSAFGASRRKKERVRTAFSSFCSSHEGDMERKIKKILERLEGIAKQKDHLGLREGSIFGLIPPPRRLPSTSLLDESEVYGRDDDRNLVIKLLLLEDVEGGSKMGVIPIVGMGGVGKTTLAQLVYNDDKVAENFELKAWICVSESFDVCGVTKTVLEAVTLAPCSVTDLNLLQVSLKDALKGRRFLIVLDDMWNENYEDWKLMVRPFEDGAQGSKIIVTTRSERVAQVMHTAPIHRLKVLLYDNCLALFMKHAFGDGDFSAHPELEAVGREIVDKCKGLPLAAKTLGGLLRSKLNFENWEMVLKSEIWDFPDAKSNILPALRLSYHYLPSHLKRCFAYCSMFPKNYEFKKDQMVLLWMAENLLQSPSKNKRIEEVGEEYFNDLVSRSFFQRSVTRGSFSLWHSNDDPFLREEETDNKCIYLMHDLMHDLAKYVSREYCLQLEDGRTSGTMKKVRHLAYISTSDDFHKRLCYALEATRLRTFLPVLHYDIKDYLTIPSCKIVHDLLLKLRCLRVLSLSRYKNIDKVLDSTGELRHLRYLDLSHTNISKLPESVSMLYNLQTLKLNSCKNLRKLPTDFHNLINLRYLDVRCCNIDLGHPNVCFCDVVETPRKISKLKSLQMLSTFVVGKDSGSRIGELREHLNLQGELRIKGLENVVNAKDEKDQARLMDKRHLEALALEWSYADIDDTMHAHDVLDMLLPNETLKKLKIDGYSGIEYPNWFRDDTLSNIVFLELRGLRNCSSLPPLGQLPFLKILDISGFDAVVTVGPEFYGTSSASDPFSSLEILKFTSMSSWKRWISAHAEDSRTFTRLQELEISYCNKLTGDLPTLLPSLTKLTIRCKKLASTLPRVPSVNEIEFGGCENQQQFKTFSEALEQMERCPRHLRISSCSSTVRMGHLPPTVEKLDISFCKDLEFPSRHPLESLNIRRCCDSLVSFPLESFPKLKDLKIYYFKSLESISNPSGLCQGLASLTYLSIEWCPSFVSFPKGGIPAPKLSHLVIDSCKRLKSLPEKMHTLLPSLQSLSISDCPEITSFPEAGLPFSLRSLDIKCCDKLVASRMSWNLQRLPNLKKFRIIGISRYEEMEPVRCVGSSGPARYQDVQSFPEEELLPATLSALWISKFPCLKSLDRNGLQKLTSLKYLCIFGCPKLQMIPKEGLPTSLRHLNIFGCPLLEKKCNKKNGKYWSKINHIKTIHIGDEYF